ncbi:MAG: hypothetical protein KDJ49_08105 [Alphaproteobacteria bacterium]|nr:hypothetical protein [Alphaproteobacteria bacterium]USO07638.1 MAG: hypothetical protein H6866_09580 [Rhodospirillales bacterium]
MTCKAALITAFVLAFWAGAPALAQDGAAAPAPGATTGLPFVNNANQPVLQPLTPGAAPITPAQDSGEAVEAGHNAEHGADAHGKQSGLPQFDTATFPRQWFWLFLTFALLYVVFANRTLPRIGQALEARGDRIAADLKQAEILKAEVASVKAEYEAAIATARADAQKSIANLQIEMKRTAEAEDAAYKSKTEAAVSALESKIAANRERVVSELNAMAAGVAQDITARIAGVKTDDAAARTAIDNAHGMTAGAKAA